MPNMMCVKCRIILVLCLLVPLIVDRIGWQPSSAMAASPGTSEEEAAAPGAETPTVLIVDEDEVYLFFDPKASIQLGQRLEIFQVFLDDDGKISAPFGKPVATVRVIELDKDGAITRVIDSSGLIKEGYIAKALPFEAEDAAEVGKLQTRIPVMKEEESPLPAIPETSLERAEREGVPSPLSKIVVGRRVIYQMLFEHFSGQQEIVTEQRLSNEVLSQTETEYTVKTVILSYKTTVDGQEQKSGQWPNKELIIVMRKDGKPTKMSNANYSFFQSGGRMWPQGKIKVGDTWEYWTRTEHDQQKAVMKMSFRFKAAGLDQYMGRDCLLIDTEAEYLTEKQTGDKKPHLPVTATISKGTMYLDYERGVILFHESTNQSVTKLPQSNQEFKAESSRRQKLIRVEGIQ